MIVDGASVPDREQFTNHQSPITNHQSPITNYQLPITKTENKLSHYVFTR
ncbi:MAG: hypothetical protein HC849_19185 [Oscillatoriales cyanobacterium RU_3_3]|nr:hypothetical protein [Oscillatoriales cyanobacterium RU_3_3]